MPAIDYQSGTVRLYQWERRRLVDVAKLARIIARVHGDGTPLGIAADGAAGGLDEVARLCLVETPEDDTPHDNHCPPAGANAGKPAKRRPAARRRSAS